MRNSPFVENSCPGAPFVRYIMNKTRKMQKITPFLWFDDQAEEAVNFYTSLFKNSKIGRIFRYTEEAAEKTGVVPSDRC